MFENRRHSTLEIAESDASFVATPPPFTAEEREWVLDSVIASQAQEGVIVSRETAARLLDELEGTPLPNIG